MTTSPSAGLRSFMVVAAARPIPGMVHKNSNGAEKAPSEVEQAERRAWSRAMPMPGVSASATKAARSLVIVLRLLELNVGWIHVSVACRLLSLLRLHELPELFLEIVETAAGGARDGEDPPGVRRVDCRDVGDRRKQIALGENQDVRLVVERAAVEAYLLPQTAVRRLRIRMVQRHQEGQHAGALDVLKELEPESLARVCALDDAGNVGDHERAALAQAGDAEIGLERRERIVGDPGTGRGEYGQQRALPRVRLAHEADIGNQLEDELDLAVFALFARLPLPRGLVRGGREARVAPSAAAAAGDQQPVAVAQHFTDQDIRRCVPDDGARRHGKRDVGCRCAGHGLALPVLRALGLPMVAIAVIEEGGEIRIALHVDTAAPAAVAAVRPAFRLVFEPRERAGSRSSGPRGDAHDRAVDEHQPPGLQPSRTVRQSSFTFFHWSKLSSGFTMESTPSIWPNDAPALSAPLRWECSWRGASSTAVWATMQSSRRIRSRSGRPSVRPYPSVIIHMSMAGCSAFTLSRSLS